MRWYAPFAALAVCFGACDSPASPVTVTQSLAATVPERAVVFALDMAGRPLLGIEHEDRRAAHLPTTYALYRGDEPLDVEPVTAAAYDGPRDRLAWVTADGELQVRDDGSFRTIARNVQPGIAFSHNGDAVVFASGIAPELDVFVARIEDDSAPSPVAPAAGPQYLPAFDDHAQRVVMASSGALLPVIQIVDRRTAQRRTLEDAAILPPDGVVAPIWSGSTIAYFDGTGVRLIDPDRGGHRLLGGARGVVRDLDGGLLVVRASGALTRLTPQEEL